MIIRQLKVWIKHYNIIRSYWIFYAWPTSDLNNYAWPQTGDMRQKR